MWRLYQIYDPVPVGQGGWAADLSGKAQHKNFDQYTGLKLEFVFPFG